MGLWSFQAGEPMVHYIFVVQFRQEVAPLWSHALEQEMYDGRSDTDSLSQGSLLEGGCKSGSHLVGW